MLDIEYACLPDSNCVEGQAYKILIRATLLHFPRQIQLRYEIKILHIL